MSEESGSDISVAIGGAATIAVGACGAPAVIVAVGAAAALTAIGLGVKKLISDGDKKQITQGCDKETD